MRKPVRIKNIRAGRTNPGLREQHLKGKFFVRYFEFSVTVKLNGPLA